MKKYLSLIACAAFLMSACEQPVAPRGAESNDEDLAVASKRGGDQDPELLALLRGINAQLADRGLGIEAAAIELFTIGAGRPSARIHQQPFRWVPGDPRRAAAGDDITYLVDGTYQGTASGVPAAATEAAIDRAMNTWNTNASLSKVEVVKVADPGVDPTIFDEFFATGDDEPAPGNPFIADIVNAGWYPRGFFAATTGAPDNVLAFSVTFIFLDSGAPSDINGDGYIDTALNEVYYNDTFGAPGEPREGNPWGINTDPPGIDVETVALHENGHSLELGHFGPPPSAVMNPVYAGIRHTPFPADQAGMSIVWKSWPNP